MRSQVPIELRNSQKQLALASFAHSTKSTYGTGLAKFHNYCDTIGLPEINRTPCTTTILAGFITYLSGFYSKSAINNFIAAVKAWNTVNMIPIDIDDKIINTLLKGAAKIQPLPLPRREPLTVQQLRCILSHLNLACHEQAAVAACLTTTFFCCARLGEFTVPMIKSFNPKEHVTVSNISFQKDRYFNKVTAFKIPRTKTNPLGEVLFWAPQETQVDPQKFLYNHLKLNEPLPNEHLFSFKTHNKKIPMSRTIFLRNVHTAAHLAGFTFTAGHSIRIGSTLEYLLRGVPFEVVKQIGRWSSNSFSLYLREHARILAPYIQENPAVNNDFTEYSNILMR